ncbi:MAG: TetR/AcrR family transcriptional regulator [Ilumatobacter fluminis]|uniref:TetR/AcrR family transcriptional regulator n=1 Tax=Ilumatobacter fluminis TaxID=467091 RepID=UPI0032EEB731
MNRPPSPRRGRLPADERSRREADILDAALELLVDDGTGQLTMLAVAKRAGASKETLYSWFGDRSGLIRALIERNGERAAVAVRAAMDDDGRDPRDVLIDHAAGLLRLLTSPGSVALNRAAMDDPELAAALLAGGRYRVGPIVEEYLARLDETGRLPIPDPAAAYRLLYGLTIRDVQITVLLGDEPPSDRTIADEAALAVDRFFTLLGA